MPCSIVVPYLVTHRQAQLVVLPFARGENAKLVRKLNKMNWNYLLKTDEEDTSFSKNQWAKKVICLGKIHETKCADHRDFSHLHGPCLTSDVFRPACWWQHNLSFCCSSQTLMCTTCHHPDSDSGRYGWGLITYISNKLPRDTDAIGMSITLWAAGIKVCGPAASGLCGILLEMQILPDPHPRLTESETLGVGSRNLSFKKLSR